MSGQDRRDILQAKSDAEHADPPDEHEVLTRLGVLKPFYDAWTGTRKQAARLFYAKERRNVILPDGTVGGVVSMSESTKGKAYVADPDSFARWVEDNYPGEVVVRAREAFATRVCNDVDRLGGELPPGVAIKPSKDPYPIVNQSEEERDNVLRNLRDGSLPPPLDGPVTALTAGPRDE